MQYFLLSFTSLPPIYLFYLFSLPFPSSFPLSLGAEVSDMNFAVLMQVITFHISPTPPLFSAGVLCSGDRGCGSGPGAVETKVWLHLLYWWGHCWADCDEEGCGAPHTCHTGAWRKEVSVRLTGIIQYTTGKCNTKLASFLTVFG